MVVDIIEIVVRTMSYVNTYCYVVVYTELIVKNCKSSVNKN